MASHVIVSIVFGSSFIMKILVNMVVMAKSIEFFLEVLADDSNFTLSSIICHTIRKYPIILLSQGNFNKQSFTISCQPRIQPLLHMHSHSTLSKEKIRKSFQIPSLYLDCPEIHGVFDDIKII